MMSRTAASHADLEVVRHSGDLSGIRVLELADEQAEYCGLLLASLGATVVKVEPTGGSRTRSVAPFLDDEPGPERSLYFWAYNRGKQSLELDLDAPEDRKQLRDLIGDSDVFLESMPAAELQRMDISHERLASQFPHVISARVSPFGDTGPWSNFKGSDLIHLALGGQMMNCGYDPKPDGAYDVPPIAPQMWHAYHVAGEQLAVAIATALFHRERTGRGQHLSLAVHEAVAKNTELDLSYWLMLRTPLYRQTCRHAADTLSDVPWITHTKDGRWIMMLMMSPTRELPRVVRFLDHWGMAEDLPIDDHNLPSGTPGRQVPGSGTEDSRQIVHAIDVWSRFVARFTFADFPWREAQAGGLLCVPLLQPHETLEDSHWWHRGTLAPAHHDEHGRSFTYPVSRSTGSEGAWPITRRAPHVGEDTARVLSQPSRGEEHSEGADGHSGTGPEAPQILSARGKPFALAGVRVLDFTWFLASAGATRFLSAYGAECIKVEWKGHPDTRLGAMAPVGERGARDRATAPLEGVTDPDMGGHFNNKNAGKLGLSLNVRDPRGLDIAKRLVKLSDVVAEGFSPGVMDRWGLGYDVLRTLRPDVIYAQQSGMGSCGTYGRMRAVGPIAASLAGMSEMSGLPQPAMPAGWGYSYLDWIGAYSFALAIISALYERERTGRGKHIDSSQTESGIFQNAVAMLDWQANHRAFSRQGNRHPFDAAAPHGAYPCVGTDRWLAIDCRTDGEWRSLARVAGQPGWTDDPSFATLDARIRNQDTLDELIADWTRTRDRYDLMAELQAAGVPAGVCQTAEDRVETDPQLSTLDWLIEVTGTKIGTWPLQELPVELSETPSYIGGTIDRGAPGYGEDNVYVLGALLGYSTPEIGRLQDDGVI
jgi:crotonobetainyl-CoA:carnitine CoA-transferase CaiB-like acyl-CoA transferase